LSHDHMPLAGLLLNRLHAPVASKISAEEAAAAADALDESDPGATAVLRVHAQLARQARREREVARRFTQAHPDVAVAAVTAQPVDVHDVDGLRTIGEELAEVS